MNNKRSYNDLRELAWRRPLTPPEEAELRAWLTAHPGDQADWELESAINAGLTRLPDAPVPSNFTSLVLQAARRPTRHDRTDGAATAGWRRLFGWAPRLAFGSVLLAVVLVSFSQVRESRRKLLVESVTAVSEVATLPSPEALRDFEVIRVLDRAPVADEELLRLLE